MLRSHKVGNKYKISCDSSYFCNFQNIANCVSNVWLNIYSWIYSNCRIIKIIINNILLYILKYIYEYKETNQRSFFIISFLIYLKLLYEINFIQIDDELIFRITSIVSYYQYNLRNTELMFVNYKNVWFRNIKHTYSVLDTIKIRLCFYKRYKPLKRIQLYV